MPLSRFNRPKGERRYKKLFFIATEGAKTEPQYINVVRRYHQSDVHIEHVRVGDKSAPLEILKHLKDSLRAGRAAEKAEVFRPGLDPGGQG